MHAKKSYKPGVSASDIQLLATHTSPEVWNRLKGQHIFITGGTGFVGSWLLEALVWANHSFSLDLNVSVLSRNPQAFLVRAPHLASDSAVRLICADVMDLNGIRDPFDVIIHAAADIANPPAEPLRVSDTIVEGTRQTLALAGRANAKRYLYLSSGAVYGRQPAGLLYIPESYLEASHVSMPESGYGQAKRVAEGLVRSCAHSGLHTNVARLFALVGPYMRLDAHFAIGNFVRDALRGDTITVKGDGTPYRSYLYAADMAVWLLTILTKGEPSAFYNVGSESALTIRQLAATVSRLLGGKIQDGDMKPVRAEDSIERYVPATSKARTLLDLAEYTDLASAIIKTAGWPRFAQSHESTCFPNTGMETSLSTEKAPK